MKLTDKQKKILKELMISSIQKGNLATSAIVLDEKGNIIDSSDSIVASGHDATAHAELRLISRICKSRKSNYTPNLTMISVIEPCLMCMSASSQAGYKEIFYIIPAEKFLDINPLITDVKIGFDKNYVASQFSESFELVHLKEYEKEFSELFTEINEKYTQKPVK